MTLFRGIAPLRVTLQTNNSRVTDQRIVDAEIYVTLSRVTPTGSIRSDGAAMDTTLTGASRYLPFGVRSAP
jgi:hypothetical protein